MVRFRPSSFVLRGTRICETTVRRIVEPISAIGLRGGSGFVGPVCCHSVLLLDSVLFGIRAVPFRRGWSVINFFLFFFFFAKPVRRPVGCCFLIIVFVVFVVCDVCVCVYAGTGFRNSFSNPEQDSTVMQQKQTNISSLVSSRYKNNTINHTALHATEEPGLDRPTRWFAFHRREPAICPVPSQPRTAVVVVVVVDCRDAIGANDFGLGKDIPMTLPATSPSALR